MWWNVAVTIIDENHSASTHCVRFVGGHWTTGSEYDAIEGWNLGNVCAALCRTFDVREITVMSR